MSVFHNNALIGAGGGAADAAAAGPIKSVRFSSGDSAYLNRTPSSAGNRKTFTFSCWLKRGNLTAGSPYGTVIFSADTGNAPWTAFQFESSDATLQITTTAGSSLGLKTNAVFRDPSAWYHLVIAFDTTQSTASDRVKCYVNGVAQTFSNTNYPAQNSDTKVNGTFPQYIGFTNNQHFDGYLADIYLIDGSALDPTSFGAFDDNGVWQAAAYSGTFGTNGFHLLDFASESTIGADSSGNENDFTANNFSTFDGTVATASGALPILNTTDNHGGTVGSGTRTDSNSSSIVLALPLNGTNGGTTFTDQSATIKGSGSAKTITRNGDVDTVTSLSQFYGSSAEFDGTDDYLTFSHTGGLGSGDFTIEYWVYHDSLYNNITHFCNTRGSTGFNVGTNANGDFIWYDGTMGIQSASAFSANRWYHCAFVRSGTTITAYLDGTSKATYTSSTDYSASSFAIGALTNGDEDITGHMQDVRMYVGAAKYTSNFNPPSRTGGSGCDSLFDVPTNGTQSDTGAGGEISGNYCCWNALNKHSNVTLSNGNLDFSNTASSNYGVLSTIGVTSGKYYIEHFQATGPSDSLVSGFMRTSFDAVTDVDFPNDSSFFGYTYAGRKWSFTSQSNGNTTLTVGSDILCFAIDLDAGKAWAGKNGVWFGSGDPSTGANPYWTFTANTDYTFATVIYNATGFTNWGQRAFAYSAPSNFKALCTTNLPTPTIADGSAQFDTKLYTGTGATQTISGLNFSPDLVWIKRRSGSTDHNINDTVRGAGKQLASNQNYAEVTNTNNFAAFTSDGFTVGTGSQTNAANPPETHVAWAWTAGANSNKTYTVKVVSDSGNKYRFDDFGTSAVTLDLAEGSTYVFDQSDSSNSGHPLRFSTTSDGTHNSGTEYTTGVTATGTPGSAGAKTTIVIPAGTTYSDDLTATSSGAYFASGAGAADAFDGNLNNSAISEPNGSTITWSPTGGIAVSTSLRVYRGSDTTSNTVNISVNGGSSQSFARGSWVDLSFTGTLTSLAITSPSANPGLSAVEIDGVVLEDSNSTPTLYYYCSSHSGMGGQANTNSTAGASNFDGNLQATVKASQTAGFSIVSWTGNGSSSATVGHSLGVAPETVIIKGRETTNGWSVYHKSLTSNYVVQLNSTSAQFANSATSGGGTGTPTSSVLTFDSGSASVNNVNKSGNKFIAYCFAPVANYSHFSSWEGNGSSDGPFIYTGFRPRFALFKCTSHTNSWQILDAARDSFNEATKGLFPNLSNAEISNGDYDIDMLSNGIKIRTSDQYFNGSGKTFLIAAFAENPFSANGGLAR